jgi:hypothetical protein
VRRREDWLATLPFRVIAIAFDPAVRSAARLAAPASVTPHSKSADLHTDRSILPGIDERIGPAACVQRLRAGFGQAVQGLRSATAANARRVSAPAFSPDDVAAAVVSPHRTGTGRAAARAGRWAAPKRCSGARWPSWTARYVS